MAIMTSPARNRTPERKTRRSRRLETAVNNDEAKQPVQEEEEKEAQATSCWSSPRRRLAAVLSTLRRQEKATKDDAANRPAEEEEELYSRSFWSSPWRRLSGVLFVMSTFLIVAAILKPFDRLVNMMLPPSTIDNEPEITASYIDVDYTVVNNSRPTYWTNTPLDNRQEDAFPFRQCADNATQCCNGLENTCDLRINEVMFATVHNAMSTKQDGSLLAPNHLLSLESALEAGYRGLHLQVCKCNGMYEFCNGVCMLGSRNPVEVFLNIDRFLRDNTGEVIILHLDLNHEAHQEVSLEELYQVMQNATNFNHKLYAHGKQRNHWPTLRRLIDSDKRVLAFHSNGPSCVNSTCPRGMHSWDDYMLNMEVETYGHSVEAEHLTTICSTVGITDDDKYSSRGEKFLELRHFPKSPNYQDAVKMNEFGFLSQQVEACSEEAAVGMLSVDYWSLGNVVEFVQRQNRGRVARA